MCRGSVAPARKAPSTRKEGLLDSVAGNSHCAQRTAIVAVHAQVSYLYSV